MKTNIVTPITQDMRETLPKGYAIYGNGCDKLAKLVEKAGSPNIIVCIHRRWSSPHKLVGNNPNFIYAVPIGSVLCSLLCEDEMPEPTGFTGDMAVIDRLLKKEGFRLSRGSLVNPAGDWLPTVCIDRPDTPAWQGVWSTVEPDQDEAHISFLLSADAINLQGKIRMDDER